MRRTLLFLVCAVVLLAAGFAWGSSHVYNQFYSPEASLERELIHLDFNGRVLHFVNQAEPQECRRELVGRLQQQISLARKFLPEASSDTKEDTLRRLQAVEKEMKSLAPTDGDRR